MTAARAFRMKCVDSATLDCCNGVFDKTAFIQGVCMNHYLNIQFVSYRQATIDGCGCGSPVFVKF